MKHFMKYRLFLFLFFCFSIISCSEEEGFVEKVELKEQQPYFLEDESILKRIEDLGFVAEKVLVYEDYFILENDIALSRELVEDFKKQTAVAPSLAMDFINTDDVTFFIHPSVSSLNGGTSWIDAIRDAVIDWNSIANCSINLIEVFSQNDANITIYADNSSSAPASHRNLPSNVWARATFPENGDAGSIMSINDNPPATLNLNGRVSIMRHEFGHCLGFHHSTIGTSGTTTILCGTNTNDPTSIMKPTLSGTSVVNLNQDDIRGARLLYPVFNSIYPNITVTSGRYDRRSGRKPCSVRMNNDNGIDWNKMLVEVTYPNGAVGPSRLIDCAPEEGQTRSFSLVSNFSRVQITFFNHKEDVQSVTNIFNNL